MEIREVKALIISGDGINADNELQRAFKENGAITSKIHINNIIENPTIIHQYDILAFPGGFSFGDEIRSGKVIAIKMKNKLQEDLIKFKNDKKLIIGICNGFQILVQLNLFSTDISKEKEFTLTTNDHGEFKNFWTKIKLLPSQSPWLQNFDSEADFYLPVRHKEGRIFGKIDSNLYALKYESPINGSIDNIAGIIDETGVVFGLMPHPEAATSKMLQPTDIPENNFKSVEQIFKNAITYTQNRI